MIRESILQADAIERKIRERKKEKAGKKENERLQIEKEHFVLARDRLRRIRFSLQEKSTGRTLMILSSICSQTSSNRRAIIFTTMIPEYTAESHVFMAFR